MPSKTLHYEESMPTQTRKLGTSSSSQGHRQTERDGRRCCCYHLTENLHQREDDCKVEAHLVK
jgi:hypothetical protein